MADEPQPLRAALILHATVAPPVIALAANGVWVTGFSGLRFGVAVLGVLLFFWPALLVSSAVQTMAIQAYQRQSRLKSATAIAASLLALPAAILFEIMLNPTLRFLIQNADDFLGYACLAAAVCLIANGGLMRRAPAPERESQKVTA